jgi:hypothetical protein
MNMHKMIHASFDVLQVAMCNVCSPYDRLTFYEPSHRIAKLGSPCSTLPIMIVFSDKPTERQKMPQ